MLSQRSLKWSSFLFILFCCCCSVAVISTLSSSSLICSFASFILLLISSRVFSFQFLFISVCSLFLLGYCLTFLVSSWSVPLFSFLDLGASSLSLLWILFWVDCLSQLHLVVLLGFVWLLHLEQINCLILSFCDYNFHSIGCSGVVPLASDICPLVGEAGLEICGGLMVGKDNGTPLQYSCLENHMDGGAW